MNQNSSNEFLKYSLKEIIYPLEKYSRCTAKIRKKYKINFKNLTILNASKKTLDAFNHPAREILN